MANFLIVGKNTLNFKTKEGEENLNLAKRIPEQLAFICQYSTNFALCSTSFMINVEIKWKQEGIKEVFEGFSYNLLQKNLQLAEKNNNKKIHLFINQILIKIWIKWSF